MIKKMNIIINETQQTYLLNKKLKINYIRG